ncbi:hypothetical protein C8A01DRAFT_21172, partial [Parachaetomium inaequale]
TPFVPPQSCADQFITATFISNSSGTVTVLASDPANSRFAACQPSGWDAGGEGERSFQFSPAVCPSGWTAYKLGRTVSGVGVPVTHKKTFSAAYCCSRHFTHGMLPNNRWRGRHHRITLSDIPSLSPTPPQLPCSTSAVVPGATVEPDLVSRGTCNSNDGILRMSSGRTGTFWFLAVGLPIIILAIIATCVGVWYRRRRCRSGKEEIVGVRLS